MGFVSFTRRLCALAGGPFFPAAGLLALAALPTLRAEASHRQIPMQDYVQEVWDARDGGLPHPSVTTIYQTRDHHLWIGTYAGLARFDGLAFHLLAEDGPTSVLADHVRNVAEADDGTLWVGTRHAGLARLEGGRVRLFTTADGLVSNDISFLAVTGDGTAWTGGEALVAVHPDGRVRHYGTEDGMPAIAVTTLFKDTDGTLWVGGPTGSLCWYDGTRFHPVRWAPDGERSTINALARDREGRLWIGTSSGLFRLESERSAAPITSRRLSGAVTALAPGPAGFWAGTPKGLVRLDADGEQRYAGPEGLLHEAIVALRQDVEGSLWLGTRVGMIQLRPRIIRSYTRDDGLPNKLATCVLESRAGDLWVGTNGGLTRRHAGQWSTFGTADGLPHAAIRALAESADGSIWIGTADGVARYSGGRFTALRGTERPYLVRSLAIDANDRIWIGSYEHGIDREENGALIRVVARRDSCTQSRPNFIHPTASGGLWIGGSGALMRFADGRLACINDPKEPSRDDVRYIAEAAEGGLWIGSIGGLGRVGAGGTIEAFSGARAPFNTPNYAVVDDGRGSLWCSTPKGLFQLRKEDLSRSGGLAPTRGFGVGDGLPTSVMTADGQPSAWRGRDGLLYFTSANGLAIVDPGRIEDLPAPPPVYIQRLVADGHPFSASSALRLPAGTHDVEVQFAAVSFVAPELVRYRYQLEGFDAGWREGENRRSASYTNLRPGHYRFRVLAADHTGTWNETGATLALELPPRLHQTLWFRILIGAALVAAVVAAHRLRLAHLQAEAAELQHKVDEAVASIQVLRGLLPMCAWCRRVRQDTGYWQQIDQYLTERSDARFSKSLCADCAKASAAEAGTR